MSIWIDTGRPAILKALTAVCDQIDAEARAEVAEQNRWNNGLLAELERLKTRVANVNRLEEENKSLKADLQRLHHNGSSNDNPTHAGNSRSIPHQIPKKRRPLGEQSPNKRVSSRSASLNDKPAQQHDNPSDFQNRYTKLSTKFKNVTKSLDEHRSALKKRNDTVMRWAKYADSLEAKIKRLEKRLEPQGNLTDKSAYKSKLQSTASDGFEGLEDDFRRPSPDSSFVQPLPVSREMSVVGAVPLKRIASDPPVTRPMNMNQQEDGLKEELSGMSDESLGLPPQCAPQYSVPNVEIKSEPSSDGPQIISEKPVRKRKHGEVEKPTDKRSQIMKRERSSSGAEVTGGSYRFAPHSSFDLDEAGDDVSTPRKRRSLPRSHYESQDQEHEYEGVHGYSLPVTSRFGSHRNPRQMNASRSSVQSLSEVGRSSALLDILTPQQRPVSEHAQSTKNRRSNFSIGHGVKDLAEDGDDEPNNPALTPVDSGRLVALLNSAPDVSPGLNQPLLHKHQLPRSTGINRLRGLPSGRKEIVNTVATTTIARGSVIEPTSARADGPKRPATLPRDGRDSRPASRDKTPLCQRPVEKLRMEDFKPNPNFNEGFDFVFDEVVRGRAARDALPGCIDPTCCGPYFRNLAQSERSNLGSNFLSRREDIKLVENYLGDDAYRISTSTRAEKEELWLEAKTWELANKYGRHRHRYPRMASPPGFWNTDFPNTQERAADKAEAERMMRALVKDRHIDAKRGNGRWLFRDE